MDPNSSPPSPDAARIAALERRVARLHGVAVTLVAAVVALVAWQLVPRGAVVEAREFILRDGAGRNRGALTLLDDRFPALRLNNTAGRARAIMIVRDDESAVFRLSDRQGQHRVQLWTEPEGAPALAIADAEGYPLVRAWIADDEGGVVELRDPSRAERWRAP